MASTKTLIVKTKSTLLSALENPELLEEAIKECNRDLRNLYGTLKLAPCRSMKSSVTNTISILTGFRTQMKLLRRKVVSGYKKPHQNRANYASTRVKWEDIQSAFNNR